MGQNVLLEVKDFFSLRILNDLKNCLVYPHALTMKWNKYDHFK